MAQLLKNIYGHGSRLSALLQAQQDKHLPHALLFSGPSGIGKKKTALALAQVLLCEKEKTACGRCPSCIGVEQETSQDMLFIQPEGLYIKLESIRQISRFLSLQSFAPARVIIIDSAHQMNLQSANSLLKILEEPPTDVYFILISSHLSALPVTVRSRVQILRFAPLQLADLHIIMKMSRTKAKKLKKNTTAKTANKNIGEKEVSLTATADQWMIQASQGSMDNLIKWQENKNLRDQAFELLEQAVRRKEMYSWVELADIIKNRDQALFVCLCWQQILRDACVIQLSSKGDIIHQDQRDFLDFLQKIPFEALDVFFRKTVELEQDLKRYLDSPLAFDNLFLGIRSKMKALSC